MKVLYVGYWGSEEPLTVATIFPHLHVLSSYSEIEEIIFCSIERYGDVAPLSLPKIRHIPLFSKNLGSVLLTKVNDHVAIFRALAKVCKMNAIDLVICRSALAGAYGHRLKKKFNLPFVVESFEPHRDYMVQSHIWRPFGLRAILQAAQEKRQKKSAKYLLPASFNYADQLREEGIQGEKIVVLPCCVDIGKFRFDGDTRNNVRERNGIPGEAIVGIYVGKFGGIYYWDEAFDLYKKAFDFFGDSFRLIILSGHDPGETKLQLRKHRIDERKVILHSASHHEVNGWLCASDFAFCTIKPAPSRAFCSPVKNGEYWACGLPILMEDGIGDDSQILERENGGFLLKNGNYLTAFKALQKLLSRGRGALAMSIRGIALRHRHPDMIRKAYDTVLFGERQDLTI